MTPFEALHPHEAFFLQGLYARGLCVRGHADQPETLYVKPQGPRRPGKGHSLRKYQAGQWEPR
jgi:hypothetical protein